MTDAAAAVPEAVPAVAVPAAVPAARARPGGEREAVAIEKHVAKMVNAILALQHANDDLRAQLKALKRPARSRGKAQKPRKPKDVASEPEEEGEIVGVVPAEEPVAAVPEKRKRKRT